MSLILSFGGKFMLKGGENGVLDENHCLPQVTEIALSH
jgi:hypothetical protein